MTEFHFKRLVAATDFSEDAGNAALRAAMLASEQRAEFELLHVLNRSSLDTLRQWIRTPVDVAERLVEDVRQTLTDHAARISAATGIKAGVQVKTGNVLSEILSYCEGANILALGARGNNSLRDALLGSTAERLLGKCRQPILIVKRPPVEAYARVLVPLDFTPGSEQVLRMATWIAPNAMLTAVHAYELPFEGRLRIAGVSDAEIEGHRRRISDQAVAEIRALCRKVGRRAEGLGHVVARGSPALVILDQQQSKTADLIVIGKHASSRLEGFLLGSVTRRLVAESACDVLVMQHA